MDIYKFYQDITIKSSCDGLRISPLDARLLIQAVFGLSAEEWICGVHPTISPQHIEKLNNFFKRCSEGEPVSRILGVREFWGRPFLLNAHTLDPRPDTETLISAVLRWLDSCARLERPLRLLDLGTGTGCILITLLAELQEKGVAAQGVGVDLSVEAVHMAEENAKRLGITPDRVAFCVGDWFSGIPSSDTELFDIIVGNPPYIPESEIPTLAPEVKNHDPILALSGGESGLEAYKIILSQMKRRLHPSGKAFLEIGFGQAEGMTRLVESSGATLCAVHPDLAGVPRVVEICYGDNEKNP